MRELQREHGKKDRGGPRFDDTRRPRSGTGPGPRPRPGSDRPPTGGGFRRPSGPGGGGSYQRPAYRPDGARGPRPDGARGSRPDGARGPRPDGARGPRPDGARGPRPTGSFRPDRDRAPRPDRFERPSRPARFEPRGERAPRFERPEGGRPDRFERPSHPARPVRSDRPERPGRPTRPNPSSAGLGPPHPTPAIEVAPLTRFRSIVHAYQQSAALLAGYSLGVFREIHRRPQSAEDIARACETDPHGMRALLEALVALGALQRHGPTYVLSRDLAPYLIPGLDGDATGQIDMASDLYQAWFDLPRGIRDGEPCYPLTGDAILEGDASRVRGYIRSVHAVSREASLRVVQMAPLLPGSSLLDVAGGSGIYAATYARQTPDLKAHLFDLAPTLDVARDILRAEGLETQIEFHAGDYRHDSFPGPVDTVLLSNVLQTESEEHAIGILRRSFDALRPGGSIVIHGVMPDAVQPPDAPVALFSLQMFVLFGHGRAWSSDQVCEWLAQERFGVRFVKPLGEPFTTKLILATRLD
jgi:3-hydroxy-5-methyl-1-naphthoate 3-O-methyltransferase